MKEALWNNEIWHATGNERINFRLPLNNGRRTQLPDYIELEKDGCVAQVHPSRIIWCGQEKKKPKREHISKREKRNQRKFTSR